jgi:hypothetical protein
MERKKTIICLILLLVPFATGILLNLYLFSSQFRGGFPISWFFRYSTGEGSSTIILFIDRIPLVIDLLIFLVVGIFCLSVYAFIGMKRGSSSVFA